MKKTLYTLLLVLFAFFARTSSAQVADGYPQDSVTVTFTDTMSNFIADTSAIPLWQMGHSYKSFFGSDSTGVTTMMTDTLHPYRANANNWFVMIIPLQTNTIVDFWHKFQTDSGHAGGAVEFSLDSGITWQNVKGGCNVDGTGWSMGGMLTSNVYSDTDTLLTGDAVFQGTQDSTTFSRIQFFMGFPVRTSSGGSGCAFYGGSNVYVRFRFISDSLTDTLAGWIIDSVKIEYDYYPGSVARISRPDLKVYPNPAYDGIFHFPALYDEAQYQVEVYNMMGSRVLSVPYTADISLERYPAGMYYYKVSSGGADYYSGKLLKE
jgi:hypothetical protein